MVRLTDRISIAASGRSGINISDPADCDVYMVDTGAGLVLVDAGVGPEGRAPLDAVCESGHALEDVKMILLTHGHADHCGNAAFLHEQTGAPVKAHRDCARYVSEGDTKAIALADAIEAGVYPQNYCFRACPTEPLEDGERLTIGETMWTAIDTPGHSSGHMCYLMEADGKRYLFAGDSIFVGGKIALQNIWDCSIADYAKTCEKLMDLEFDALLPSHHGIDLSEGKRNIELAWNAFKALGIPPQA